MLFEKCAIAGKGMDQEVSILQDWGGGLIGKGNIQVVGEKRGKYGGVNPELSRGSGKGGKRQQEHSFRILEFSKRPKFVGNDTFDTMCHQKLHFDEYLIFVDQLSNEIHGILVLENSTEIDETTIGWQVGVKKNKKEKH